VRQDWVELIGGCRTRPEGDGSLQLAPYDALWLAVGAC